MNPKSIFVTLFLAGLLALLPACSAIPVTPAGAGQAGSDMKTPTAALEPQVGIAYPAAGGPLTGELPSPAPSGAPGGTLQEPQTITLEDSGKTVQIHTGGRFVLSLGTDIYEWAVAIDDQTVLHRVVNITPLRGSQGVYEALKAGSTVLHASGDPLCAQAKPACKMPSRLFTLTVVVQ
jgi:hypothetical protein